MNKSLVLTQDYNRVRSWRSPREEFAPDTLSFRTRISVSIMVWGCTSIHGLGELHIVEENMNQKHIEVLESSLLPSIANMFGDRNHPFAFQDDNAIDPGC